MMKFHNIARRYYAPDDGTGDGTGTLEVHANSPKTGIDNEITGEDLEAAATARFGAPATDEDDGDPNLDPDPNAASAIADGDVLPPSTGEDADGADSAAAAAGEGAEGVHPAAAAGAPADAAAQLAQDVIDLGDDLTLSRDEARQWAQFGQYLRANPDAAARIAASMEADAEAAEAAQAQASTQATGAPQTGSQTPILEPPADLDLDDPAIRLLWDQHVATQTALTALNERVQYNESFVTRQQQENTESQLNTAQAVFSEKHHLSADEMARVRQVAGNLGVLPSLLAPFDPVTGAPRQVDPLKAIGEAFDMALWAIPEMRERELESRVEENKADNKRKQKLSSLGGSGGTGPRTPAAPSRDPAVRRSQMIAEVANMMQGEGA